MCSQLDHQAGTQMEGTALAGGSRCDEQSVAGDGFGVAGGRCLAVESGVNAAVADDLAAGGCDAA